MKVSQAQQRMTGPISPVQNFICPPLRKHSTYVGKKTRAQMSFGRKTRARNFSKLLNEAAYAKKCTVRAEEQWPGIATSAAP